jgi:hypothetical protein
MSGVIGHEYRPNLDGPSGFWADGLWETADGRKRWELTEEERLIGGDPWAALGLEVRNLLARLD